MLPCLGLALLLAGASSAEAEKKHPAEEAGTKTTSGDVETTIKFVNKSKQTIKVYWLDYEGERVTRKTVKAGESYEVEKTYLTPQFPASRSCNRTIFYLSSFMARLRCEANGTPSCNTSQFIC